MQSENINLFTKIFVYVSDPSVIVPLHCDSTGLGLTRT